MCTSSVCGLQRVAVALVRGQPVSHNKGSVSCTGRSSSFSSVYQGAAPEDVEEVDTNEEATWRAGGFLSLHHVLPGFLGWVADDYVVLFS